MVFFKKINMRLFFIISFLVLSFQGKAQFSPSMLIGRDVEVSNWEMCDFNNDGLLDIFGSSRFIYFQNEQGSVGSATEVPNMAKIVDIGDINGDGAYEIFATDNAGDFYLNLNDGTGVFTPILLADFRPDEVKLGDFDGNGLLDILISDIIAFQIMAGGIEFNILSVTGDNPRDHNDKPTVIYDADNDGQDELWYYRNFDKTLYKTDYQSDGSLSRTTAMVTAERVSRFNFSDLDLDGTDELILTYWNDGSNFFLHRKSGNGLVEENPFQNFQIEYYSNTGINILDIDQDGLPDIVGGMGKSPSDFSISMYAKNRGNWTFTKEEFDQTCIIADINTDGQFDCIRESIKIYNYFAHQKGNEAMGEYANYNLNPPRHKLELKDLNGDGHDDLFFGQFYKVFLPDQKIFSGPIKIESPSSIIGYLGKLDLENTGSLDNYWSDSYSNSVTRSTHLENDTYLPDEIIIDSVNFSFNSITVADLDNDGDKDFIGQLNPSPTFNSYYYWWKNEDGKFSRIGRVTTAKREDYGLWPLDVDQDGDLDIVKTSEDGISFVENLDGQGTFGESVPWTSSEAEMQYFTINPAGEVIAYGKRGQSVNYFSRYQLENNVFIEQQIYTQGSTAITIYSDLIDFDGDGMLNLFYYGGDDTTLKSADILPDGTLGDIQVIHSSLPTFIDQNIAWGDPDNDGDYDLFYNLTPPGTNTEKINAWYENLGGIDNWKDRQSINNSTRFLKQVYLDVDNDQDIDLLGIHSNRIAWYENYDGSGNFGTEQIIGDLSEEYTTTNGIGKFVGADFNNDGTTDMLAPNSGGTFTLFNNVGEEDNLFPADEKYALNISSEDIFFLKANSFTPDDFPDLLAGRDGNIMIARNDPNSNAFIPWATVLNVSSVSNDNSLKDFKVMKIEGDFGKSVLGIIGSTFISYQLFLTRMTGAPLQLSDPIELQITNELIRQLEIEVGDMDGDGDEDIVARVTNVDQETHLYWLEQIGGTQIFAESKLLIPAPIDIPLSGFRDFSLLDFNQDNKVDILSRNKVYLQLDKLEFSQAIELDIELGLYQDITPVDLNGDDRPDFLITEEGEWWDNQKIAEQGTGFFNTSGADDYTLSIWDINKDGTLDIYKSGNSYYANQITDRKSTFEETFLSVGYDLNNREIKIVDIDKDGQENLVVLDYGKIHWFKGVNYFNNPIPTTVKLSGSSNNSLLGDIDNDGDIDIVLSNNVYWQESTGIWNSQPILSSPTDFPFYYYSELGDFNNDGYLDILTLKESGVYLIFNQQGNSFSEPVLIYQDEFNFSTRELIVEDLDNDGKLDITFESSGKSFVLFQENGTVFQERVYPLSSNDDHYLTGDINQDGFKDLVYDDNKKLMVYFQTAPRTFTQSVEYYDFEKYLDTQNQPYRIILADVDNDSDLDLVYTIRYNDFNSSRKITSLYWAENVLNSNQVSGQVFYDENQNGIRDTLEQGLLSISTELSPEGLYTYSEPDGRYTYYLSPGEYGISYQNDPLWDLTTTAASYPVSIPADTVLYQSGFDFGFYPNVDLPKVIPTITSGITRCNTTVRFFVEGINQGTQINSGTLSFIKPSDVELDSFEIAPDLQIGMDTFIWNITNLYPSQKITRKVFLKMPNELSTGDEIPFQAITDFQDITTDTTINTIYEYNPILLCAYDPNDKLVSPDRSGETNYTLFEESLEYTIRFQNTGNDTAFNIIIRDTLDPNLNWNTFRPLSSSHPYTVTRNDQGVLAFDFRNIMLPDSNVNFITSQGFVKFLIDPNSGLSENTVIENTAHIYFDFNAPIVTNTIISTMVSELPITSTKNLDRSSFPPISLFPNPSTGIFNFGIPEEIPLPLTLVITDTYGREIKRQVITSNRQIIYEDFTLSSNVFFYQFFNVNNELLQIGKLIKH